MEKDRIKLLVKKMSITELDELCKKKNWSIITFEDAADNMNIIYYKNFWHGQAF